MDVISVMGIYAHMVDTAVAVIIKENKVSGRELGFLYKYSVSAFH